MGFHTFEVGERVKWERYGDKLKGKVKAISADGKRCHLEIEGWVSTEWVPMSELEPDYTGT